jgi:integrase
VLSADEIAVLWHALGNPERAMSPAIRLALKLQLVTAQRKGREFYLDDERVWTIQAVRTKNGMPHLVPVSPLALAILDEVKLETKLAAERKKRPSNERSDRPDPTGDGTPPRWLFPSPKPITGPDGKPITGPAVDRAMRNNREDLGTCDATPHDLCRTAASHMTSIGISRIVVSKILNHAAGVTAVYPALLRRREARCARGVAPLVTTG